MIKKTIYMNKYAQKLRTVYYDNIIRIIKSNMCTTNCNHKLFVLIIPQVLAKGAVVSDHELCSAFGHRVLRDGGSSVDAAITAALCLGVVHPHVSGIGGYVIHLLFVCIV